MACKPWLRVICSNIGTPTRLKIFGFQKGVFPARGGGYIPLHPWASKRHIPSLHHGVIHTTIHMSILVLQSNGYTTTHTNPCIIYGYKHLENNTYVSCNREYNRYLQSLTTVDNTYDVYIIDYMF